MKTCFKCSAELKVSGTISRNELCPKCGAYVRCCKNCEFYEEGRHNDCREPRSDYISDREGANFCDWYKTADRGSAGKKPPWDDARKKFDDLFKK